MHARRRSDTDVLGQTRNDIYKRTVRRRLPSDFGLTTVQKAVDDFKTKKEADRPLFAKNSGTR